ncbi:MAG: hypothetical protein ACRCV3_00620 [Desulfovibrionaceae bacterium]
MNIIHITEEEIQQDMVFELRLLQTISIEVSLAQTDLCRENNDFIIIFSTNAKITLYNFFMGEELGIYPKILFPTGENFSGYALIALLEPSFLKKNFLEGTHELPTGSIIEYLKMKRESEIHDSWHIADSLYVPPQSTQKQSIIFPAIDDDNVPIFYKEIQNAFLNPQIIHKENTHTEEEHREDDDFSNEESNIENDEDIPNNETENNQRYTTGYVLRQDNIDAGYSITEVNNDPSLLDTMATGQYGFLTMTYYGGFNYILGEGLEIEEGTTIEDYFSYTIETEYGEAFEGGMYIYVSKENNKNIFEYSASEIE